MIPLQTEEQTHRIEQIPRSLVPLFEGPADLEYLGVSKDKIILVLAVMDTSVKSKKTEMMSCWVFPKWNLKLIRPKVKRNNSTELWGA